MQTRFEPRRQRRPSSSASKRTPSTSGTYPQSWTPERRSQQCQRAQSNARNHRDAPPGTAVKYGNGELETIERLVDIGHYEVQVTPDNCVVATLISVDQIVEKGHTVTFSKNQTIITDEEGCFRLQYNRAQGSRDWTMPIEAMEDITILRQKFPLSRMEF